MLKNIKSFFSRKSVPAPVLDQKSCGVSTGGQQQVILQGGDFLEYAIGFGAGLTGYENLSHQRAMQFYQQSSAVATAVDIVAQEMGRITPVIKTPDGKFETSHELLDKLANPNDWNEDWAFYFGSLARSILLTGDSYQYAAGIITQPPLELYAIKPQNINTTQGSNDLRPDSFGIYNGDGQGNYSRARGKTGFRFYDGNLKELWHTMSYSSTSANMSGDSPLKAICLDIYSQIRGRLHNVQLLENGGRPSMAVIFKDVTSQDQMNERRQILNEQIAGADNAGKILLFGSNDMDMKEMGTSNKDMDYANLESISDQAIYKRYRIPLPLVTNERATMNNMEESVFHLYDFAVLPRTDELLSSLTMFLMPRYGMDPAKFQLTYDPETIPAIRGRMIEELRKRKEIGVETTNELREFLPNREDIDGGNDVLVSSTMIPLGEVGIDPSGSTMTPEEEAARLALRDGE